MAVQQISTPSELSSVHEQYSHVVVYCYADWSGPCRAMSQIFERVAERRQLPAHLAFARFNIDDDDGELARDLELSTVPTFLFFKEGLPVEVNGNYSLQGASPPALESATGVLYEWATQEKAEEA